jgi:phosphatidylglycerophosphate synthase
MMLDGLMRPLIDPVLNRLGRMLARARISANQVTLTGLALGLGAAGAIVLRLDMLALALLLASRLADGLDGAVARATRITDRGGYLDIVCDFIFYGAIPLAFALRDPASFALPAAVLLAAFYANGASFLGFAALAAKRGLETRVRGTKSLYFTTGLMEGTETIGFFVAFVLFPSWFTGLAYIFAALCMITCLSRILLAWRIFAVDDAAL